MNKATKLTLAVTLPVAAIAIAGQTASAAPAPTEPPSPEPGAVIPADFVILTDDTGTITVGVPSSWTDIDTAPRFGEQPVIEAAPNRDAFFETFDVPGVTYRAASFTADTETLTLNFGVTSGCASEVLQTYDDGTFVGSHRIYSQCGNRSVAEFHVIAANPPSQAITALLLIQTTGPDQASILDAILATFNLTDEAWAAGASTPSSTLPSTVASTAAVPTTTSASGATAAAFAPPSGPVPDGWTTLIDDTGTFTTSALTAGSHTITATYSGTATAAPSRATIVQQVNQPPPPPPPPTTQPAPATTQPAALPATR